MAVTTAGALLESLQRRGVEILADGARIGIRPAGALTAEEREALRRLKSEVLAILRDGARLPALYPVTVRETLGDSPDPHALASLRFEVAEVVRALSAEIDAGKIRPGVRTVHGRPLGDWLDLAEVASLLRAWGDSR